MSNATDSVTEQTSDGRSGKGILAGYYTEAEMAAARGVKRQALYAERRRGEGPPWVRLGQSIYYRKSGFRAWLREIEH